MHIQVEAKYVLNVLSVLNTRPFWDIQLYYTFDSLVNYNSLLYSTVIVLYMIHTCSEYTNTIT